MSLDAASPATRDRLLLAAEQLFATRGIDAVSLAEITKAAGSHNTGAVHHHFGGR
jgi:AcrR family transcriptional regulator